MFVLNLLSDALNDIVCQENDPKKHHQQYHSRPYANGSRGMAPPVSRMRSNASQANHASMKEQESWGNEWSNAPPQQSQQWGTRDRNSGSSQPQSRSRGVGRGGGQGEWSSRQPPNDGRPQQQQQQQQRGGASQQQRGPNNRQSQYSQDEMNLREVSSPRRQTSGRQGPPAKSQRQKQQFKPDNESEEVKDTVIGRGFTAAMKRGVAQAKPTPLYEEMVPQKDGGFIATIQTGFEGLFGKPTSKEEVLRKRGSVFANEYEAVPGDEVDQRVQYFARRLPEDVAGCLKIFRKAKGEYQVNDEMVNMEAKYRQNQQGQTDKEIFVFWTTEEGEQSEFEPLGLYLSHAANVAYEVQQGGNVITQVPEHVRMSFHEERGTKLTDGSADARFNAMEVAARQAKMREEAAMEWREKQNSKDNEAENLPPQQQGPYPQEGQKFQDRPPNLEGNSNGNGILDDAFKGLGMAQAPGPAPVPVPPHLPLPAGAMQGMAPPVAGFSQPNGMNMPLGATSGTFYGVQQAPYGQQLPRQGTMYAYGSASPPAVMAAAHGYPGYGAPHVPRQGTMYAYGSSYAAPVR